MPGNNTLTANDHLSTRVVGVLREHLPNLEEMSDEQVAQAVAIKGRDFWRRQWRMGPKALAYLTQWTAEQGIPLSG